MVHSQLCSVVNFSSRGTGLYCGRFFNLFCHLLQRTTFPGNYKTVSGLKALLC